MSHTRKTPLNKQHIELGARMVEFHGWLMPVQYTSIIDECRIVRESAGLFDISHMGEAEVKGAHAFELMQFITSNNLLALDEGGIQYTLMLNDEGCILDDLLIYKISDNRFFLCLNAANTESDVNWIADQALQYPDVEVRNISRQYGMLSIQGPNSEPILKPLTRSRLSDLDYYHFVTTSIGGHTAMLSRTGYTGEDGFEIYCDWRDAGSVWSQLLGKGKSFGLKPIGLGARDALRLEMGYSLYGQDIDNTTTPNEAGLGWVVKLDKPGGFIGHDALVKQKTEGATRRLIGFEMTGRGIPRSGYSIYKQGDKIGEVTSGTMSPTIGRAIGMGYVDLQNTGEGTSIDIDIRGKMVEAMIRKPPFVKSNVKKSRSLDKTPAG